jgi:hypothetical protein
MVPFGGYRARGRFPPRSVLRGIVFCMGEERIFMTLPSAVEAYRAWYGQRHGRQPEGQ